MAWEMRARRRRRPGSTCSSCCIHPCWRMFLCCCRLCGPWQEELFPCIPQNHASSKRRHQLLISRPARKRRCTPLLIVRSPVRISFAGGGTDLPTYYEQFGGAVLSMAINKYFYTILGKRSDGRIQVISSDLRIFETWRDIATMDVKGSGLEIPLAVLKELGSDISVDLFLASEIPPGTGLGSSASVCVNVLKTISSYVHLSLSRHELAERAFHVARNVLRHHVGKQDEYAAAFGGFNFMVFERDGSARVIPLVLSSDVLNQLQDNLMLFFTGAAHSSWTILKEQENSTRARHSSSVQALHNVRALASQMSDVLQAGDLRRFGVLLDEVWQSKKQVSNKIS